MASMLSAFAPSLRKPLQPRHNVESQRIIDRMQSYRPQQAGVVALCVAILGRMICSRMVIVS